MRVLYWSAATPVCFDNEDSLDGGQGDDSITPKTFTQEDVNKFLANEKRQHQERYRQVEENYQKLLKDSQLSKEDRAEIEKNLETVQSQLRTAEEQAKREKKALEETFSAQLNEAKEAASSWENRYRKSSIQRSLLDAAVANDAYSPEQVVILLEGKTELVEERDAKGKPTGVFLPIVNFDDQDAEGKPMLSKLPPSDAVKRMKDLSTRYGNLFKSGVAGGLGGSGNAGQFDTVNGRLTRAAIAALTQEQYREIKSKNPAALGLG